MRSSAAGAHRARATQPEEVCNSREYLESVLFVTLMSFWGFAQFGRFGEMELLLAAILVYGVVAAICLLWSRRYRMGPMEWLWRAGSYLGAPRIEKPRA